MSLLETLNADIKQAMFAGDKARLEVLRGLKSDIKYKEIEKREPLTEQDLVDVLSAAAKRRRDSIEQFRQGGRTDLADKETFELNIITNYLPKQLTEEELSALIAAAISVSGATTAADIGKVMKELMPKVKGRADGNRVKQLVADKLAGLT